jgi:nucleotide-binding universal stress UspA family protein
MTLRVLVHIPSPTDAPLDASAAWQQLSEALAPLESQGLVSVGRVIPATENALKKSLGGGTWDVLHFIGHAKWRRAAQYGTLIMESSSGTSRSVSTQYLGELLGQHESLKLAVLQTADGGEASVWEDGPAVVMHAGPLIGPWQSVVARKFYASLATGSTLEEATNHTRDASVSVKAPAVIVLKNGSPSARLIAPAEQPVAAVAIPTPAPHVDPAIESRRREVKRKRAAGEFDVFLCHNGSDKPNVKKIADQLEAAGILPWLDERELPPGQPWQPLLEAQIENIKSAAVFVGAAGVGPWQEQELYGFLREFTSRKSPVIPVLLQDSPKEPELPVFLRGMTWVDFRVKDPDPLSRLIWGITGQRPDW